MLGTPDLNDSVIQVIPLTLSVRHEAMAVFDLNYCPKNWQYFPFNSVSTLSVFPEPEAAAAVGTMP